jgi:hypothetical protein
LLIKSISSPWSIYRTHAGGVLYRLFIIVIALGVLALIANHYLVTVPRQHQQSLRIKAEEACQKMLDKELVNIADADQPDWKRHCINDKLSLWQ